MWISLRLNGLCEKAVDNSEVVHKLSTTTRGWACFKMERYIYRENLSYEIGTVKMAQIRGVSSKENARNPENGKKGLHAAGYTYGIRPI